MRCDLEGREGTGQQLLLVVVTVTQSSRVNEAIFNFFWSNFIFESRAEKSPYSIRAPVGSMRQASNPVGAICLEFAFAVKLS